MRPICLAKNRRLLLPRLVKLRSVNFPSEKDQSSLDTKSVFRVRGGRKNDCRRHDRMRLASGGPLRGERDVREPELGSPARPYLKAGPRPPGGGLVLGSITSVEGERTNPRQHALAGLCLEGGVLGSARVGVRAMGMFRRRVPNHYIAIHPNNVAKNDWGRDRSSAPRPTSSEWQ